LDPADGSLLVTQSDRVLRLTAPAGAGFTIGGKGAPVPADLTLLGSGVVSLLGYDCRRRKQVVTA
jgi:hypothetical protein